MGIERQTSVSNILEVEEYWKGFYETLAHEIDFVTAHTIFGIAIEIYKQAIRSYFSEIYEGTVILCRAALDAVLYAAITRTPIEPGKFSIGENSDYWDTLKKEIINQKIMSLDEMTKIWKLRDLGNFVAHITKRVDEQVTKLSTNPDSYKSMRIWTTNEEAKSALDQTKDYIIAVIRKYFQIHGL